jgi:hypothetical protein
MCTRASRSPEFLIDVGFTDVRFYAGPDDTEYELGASRLLLTARRG